MTIWLFESLIGSMMVATAIVRRMHHSHDSWSAIHNIPQHTMNHIRARASYIFHRTIVIPKLFQSFICFLFHFFSPSGSTGLGALVAILRICKSFNFKLADGLFRSLIPSTNSLVFLEIPNWEFWENRLVHLNDCLDSCLNGCLGCPPREKFIPCTSRTLSRWNFQLERMFGGSKPDEEIMNFYGRVWKGFIDCWTQEMKKICQKRTSVRS